MRLIFTVGFTGPVDVAQKYAHRSGLIRRSVERSRLRFIALSGCSIVHARRLEVDRPLLLVNVAGGNNGLNCVVLPTIA
ncbi:MAG: hypothetical protein ACYDGW_10850 [Vulcanimicrobiaceae bacterium]